METSIQPEDLRSHIEQCRELIVAETSFAFQTIVDARNREVIGFEALLRGNGRETASEVFSRIPADRRFDFDQALRIRAMEAARHFGVEGHLHLNCSEVKMKNLDLIIATVLEMAENDGFKPSDIVLEFNHLAHLGGDDALRAVRSRLNEHGIQCLADNYGAFDANLRPLVDFKPQYLKLARQLTDQVHLNPDAQAIIRATLCLCRDFGIQAVASRIESVDEFDFLQEEGVDLFQGYFFAQPGGEETDH